MLFHLEFCYSSFGNLFSFNQFNIFRGRFMKKINSKILMIKTLIILILNTILTVIRVII